MNSRRFILPPKDEVAIPNANLPHRAPAGCDVNHAPNSRNPIALASSFSPRPDDCRPWQARMMRVCADRGLVSSVVPSGPSVLLSRIGLRHSAVQGVGLMGARTIRSTSITGNLRRSSALRVRANSGSGQPHCEHVAPLRNPACPQSGRRSPCCCSIHAGCRRRQFPPIRRCRADRLWSRTRAS
jgi:hypothetical protein